MLYHLSPYKDIVSNAPKVIAVIALGILLGAVLVSSSVQTLAMIVAGVLLVAFLIHPAKFLLGYLVAFPILDQLAPFFTIQTSGFRLGPQIIFRGGLVILLVFYWLVNKRNLMAFKSSIPMFVLVSSLAITTLIAGIEVRTAIADMSKLAFWMILLLTVADMVAQGKLNLKEIYRSVLLSLVLFVVSLLISSSLIGIEEASFLTTRFERGYGVGEFSGSFAPHSIAVCLSMGLPVVLALAIKEQNRLFLLLLLLFGIVILISLARTYVRTGYVCALGGMLALNFMFWRYGKGEGSRRQKLIMVAALLMLAVAFAIFASRNTEALEKRFGDLSGSGRIGLWRSALKTYMDYPLFMKIIGGGYGRVYAFQDRFIFTHNGYFTFLLAGGIIGILLYIWILISLWRQVKCSAKGEYLPLMLAGVSMVIYLIAEMTNGVYSMVSATTYFSFLVGGAIGYYRIEANPESNR